MTDLTADATHPSIRTFLELTQIPTAAGHEDRVVHWIEGWVAARPHLRLEKDRAGNLVVSHVAAAPLSMGINPDDPPLIITAHLDHPAFVVERIVSPDSVELSFRGGVMDVFFDQAPIVIHVGNGESEQPVRATLTAVSPSTSPAGKHYLADLTTESTAAVRVGDIATWEMPPAEIDEQGIMHTHACDDLAAAAAAVCAMDLIFPAATNIAATNSTSSTGASAKRPNVRLLFTRAEEIGFIGAIAACKLGTMPRGSRIIALENSRAFPDSPIGGGPIVRVGDRLSIFTPWLTNACAKRAEQLCGLAVSPVASQTSVQHAAAAQKSGSLVRKWQRKLMAGGACEASVFCAYGYDATCLCLPLGNYHNMAHLTELQAGIGAGIAGGYNTAKLGPPRAAREFVAASDYLGLIDLLVAIGTGEDGRGGLPTADPMMERVEKLYAEKAYVLG